MALTMRQPFASLDGSRTRSLLRSKMNLQNKQNGALLSSKSSKLQALPHFEFDSENIDPITHSHSKRKRSHDEDEHEPVKPSKPLKTSRITLSVIETAVKAAVTPFSTPTSTKSKPITPIKPAGRSPSKKPSVNPFARRSPSIIKTRPDSASRKSVSRPFSIATALSNGKSKTKPLQQQDPLASSPKTPASWSFEIYVDSEQEEMTNLMQHSTCVLDISDDESKQIVSSPRGKENIPPAELGLLLQQPDLESPAATAAARKSMMLDESRAPLGELNAADYYGEDCHAFSYAVIHDDEDVVDSAVERKKSLPPFPRPSHPTRSKLSSVSSIESILEEEEDATANTTIHPSDTIEILEDNASTTTTQTSTATTEES